MEEDVAFKEAIKKTFQSLTKNSKDREALEVLRSTFQFCSHRAVHSLSFEIPEPFLKLLTTVLEDPQVPIKFRFLVSFLLKSLTTIEPEVIKANFRQKSYDSKVCLVLLPLLFTHGSEGSLDQNAANLIQWMVQQIGEYKSSVISLLILIAKEHRALLKYTSHIQQIETKFDDFLSKASLVSEQKHASSKSLWNLTAPTPDPVTELDGSISREIFTVLNLAQTYTEDQSFNILTFSNIHAWLSALYQKKNKTSQQPSSENEITETITLNSTFQETIIAYCLRVIEQSKLKPLTPDLMIEATVSEAIHILDLLSSLDPSLVPRLIHQVKKSVTNPTANNGTTFLAILQYILNHSEAVVYDLETVFRTFFAEFLNFSNPLVAHSTFEFCVKNRHKLLQNTNVFCSHFPALLKIVAWFPRSFADEMLTLLPCSISNVTLVEIFHSILDLPLITSVLEKSEHHLRDNEGEQQSPYRVLYNHLLRNESGSYLNFWEMENTLPLLQELCKEAVISPRLVEVTKLVPKLLSLYFDVVISCAFEDQVREFLPIVFQRVSQLFPLESFQKSVQKVIEEKTLAIFHKFPSFVVSLKELLITLIGDSRNIARHELILCVCWIVGEYTSPSIVDVSPEIINDYHETLELFAYERMSMVKFGEGGFSGQPAMSNEYITRLMLVLISALGKLAARWHPLTSNVILCLSKILRQQQYFDPAVITRASECIALLKFPSIAASILDATHKTGPRLCHVDDHSSLPFMLETTIGRNEIQHRLHQFLPT